jgi:hypothetical protein
MDKRPKIQDVNNTPGLIGLGPIPSQAPYAAFNLHQIENLLRTKGITCYHYKHAPNPDRAKKHSPANPNSQAAHRGFRFYSVRRLKVVPQQFKVEDRLNIQGIWGIGSVLFNVTGHYDDGSPDDIVYIRDFDLIVLHPSITMLTDQLIDYNPTGLQRLKYLVKGVDYLADKEREYAENRDFIVKDGFIQWLKGGKLPSKGAVLTCVYYITPIWIVKHMLHSLRLLPSNEMGHGALPRETRYAPQQLVARLSTIPEEEDLLDWAALPPLPEYADSDNVTGGSI